MVGTGVDRPEAEPRAPREGIGVPFCIQWGAVTGFNRGADVIESVCSPVLVEGRGTDRKAEQTW